MAKERCMPLAVMQRIEDKAMDAWVQGASAEAIYEALDDVVTQIAMDKMRVQLIEMFGERVV